MTEPFASLSAVNHVMQDIAAQSYPAATLYVVATPIGNVGDITLRALHILSIADAIACEDTRNTAQLLNRYGLSKTLIAAHQHNEREAAEKLIVRLQAGERIALVSDAGTPGVSDPGARIVDAVRRAGLKVVPVAGACAAVAALSASGLIDDRFHFIGFLPAKAKQRDTLLAGLKSMQGALIMYEAPHRIAEMVSSLMSTFEPTREIVFARELSKLFEEVHRCPLSEASAWVAGDTHREKGEYVVLVEGAAADNEEGDSEAVRILSILLEECSVKLAAALTAKITGAKKNTMYEMALNIHKDGDADTAP